MAIKKKVQTFSIDIPLIEQIKAFSNDTGIPVSRIADAALRDWLNKRGVPNLKASTLSMLNPVEG